MGAQLSKGMYGTEFSHTSTLFGLRCGQMRRNQLVHNGGWYNKDGEKIGWGDLSPEDFVRIADGLDEGELFIVLGEYDSYWNLRGKEPQVKLDIEAPGVDYMAEVCHYIIAKGELYYVDRYGSHQGKETVQLQGVTFKVLERGKVKELITRPMI